MAEVAATFTANISGYKSAMNQMARSTTDATGSISKMRSSAMSIAKGVGAVALVSKGIGVLRDSVGSAVARFDTLNAYPKVMKQMGYSTSDTNKSVGILKKGVDGLPTSLQDLTKSAQSFAILEKNASKGAKTATALNDAFLASGASAGDASRGVQQYSQMLATGKVDMQSWRTLQETMPYALTKVARSFGLTGKSAERDLYAKLKSGEITMDELNARFVKLDGGAKGFAKTARSATGGIGTSFTNMRNAVTNGMADMLTSIDNGLKKAGTGGIAKIFDQAKAGIKSAFKAINAVVQASMPVVVGVFKTLYPVVKNLAPLIAGLGGGFIAASFGATAISKAVNGVASAFGAVTRHPILSMILLLATAFYEAYTNIKPFHDFVNKLVGKIGELAGKIPQSTSAMNGLKAALGVLGGGAGLGIVIAGFYKFKNGLDVAKKATESIKSPLSAVKEGVGGLGTSSKGVSPKMMGIATAILKIGVGAGVASAGIGLMALGFAKLASTGNSGLIVIAAMVVAIIAVAGAFALLGPALTTNTVGIGVFGAAILAVGVGVAAFGLGIKEIAQAMSILSKNVDSIVPLLSALGIGFVAMITSMLTSAMASVPKIALAFNQMMIKLMAVISSQAPAIATSFSAMLISLMTAVSVHAPAIALAFTTMLVSVMNAITQNAPAIITSFSNMLIALMTAIATNAPALIASFSAMIVSLINSLTAAIPSLVAAGVGFVVALIGAIGSQAPALLAAGIALVGQLAQAFVVEMPLLIQIAGATLAAVIAVLATYAGQMTAIGGILLHALAAGFTGQKYDAIGAATDVIQSSGAAASVAGQSAFKAAGGDAAIQSAQAIANSKGNHQSAGAAVGKAGAAGVSSTTGSFTSAGGSVGNAAASGINGKSGSARASGSSLGQSGASGIKSTSGYFTGAGTSIGSAAASGLNGQKGHANSVGRDLGSSSANAVKDGTSGVDLYSNGDSLMGGFLSGLRDKYSAVQSFVSGIAGWIKAHKGPISYDAKLLIPAGNAMMNGLNSGLMNSFSTVQKNVSGMADKLSESINSVAGDIKTGDLSMQAASYQGGSIDQNIDTNNWVKPTISVHNELVGDKIRTIVSQGQADDQVSSKFFMS